jgi:coatomer subunit beta'
MKRSNDLEGLLLLYQVSGHADGMRNLADRAGKFETISYIIEAAGKINVAFTASILLSDTEKCIELLSDSDRIPEAAIMARTFAPRSVFILLTLSHVSRLVSSWKDDLQKLKKPKVAESIADPSSHPNLFADFEYSLFAEDSYKKGRSRGFVPASDYEAWKDSLDIDILGRKIYLGNVRIEKQVS